MTEKHIVKVLYKLCIENNSMLREVLVNQAEIELRLDSIASNIKIEKSPEIEDVHTKLKEIYLKSYANKAHLNEVITKERLLGPFEIPVDIEASASDYELKPR